MDIDSNVEGFSRFVDDDRWFLKEADVQVANQVRMLPFSPRMCECVCIRSPVFGLQTAR